MRTLLTLLLPLVMATPAFSQVNTVASRDTVPVPKYRPFNRVPADAYLKKIPKNSLPGFKGAPVDPYAKKHDSLMALLNSLSKRPPVTDRMPNAIAVQPFPNANSVYRGNNGEGFDIYESGIDRMPVLMPDSINARVLRLPVQRKP